MRHDSLESPTDLTPRAQREYRRLLGMLRAAGTLERVDLGIVAEAARVLDLLDRAYPEAGQELDPKAVGMICRLTAQRRGLLRELALTLQPSRTMFHAKAKPAKSDKWSGLLKVS